MSKLTGVFDNFEFLDKISIEEILKWLKVKIEPVNLGNYLANRIYYPQSVPISPQEMETDLAILKEAIRKNQEKFYDKIKKRIIIPEEFSLRFAPLYKLVAAFIDGIDLGDQTLIYQKKINQLELLASVYIPKTFPPGKSVPVKVKGKSYDLKFKTLTLLPVLGNNIKFSYNYEKEIILEGGSMGIFVELRHEPRS